MLGLGGDDPRQLGPYRVRAVIGDGGMGRVYLATSPGGRAVAVKVIGPGRANQPGYRERFAREARAAMSVSGLYTASVVDADTTGERPYIATEFVPAPSLAEATSKAGPLPPETVFALAGGLAEALAAIHRAGLVHRDVKPHNILLASDGPVVIDFGIAVGDETSLTAVGMTVGTPGYIAPEVLRGQDPTPLSDVFSLACVLVFAARGTGPFGTGDPLAVAHRTANEEPDLNGVPMEVRALVAPMLNRDPGRRPNPAQLLEHVALSSRAVLHDGMWLPEGVRALLEQRRLEVQRALADAGPIPSPAMPTMPPPAPAYRTPVASTPAGDFSQLHGGTPPPPVRRSRAGFIAAVTVGAAVVMAGAVFAVVLLANGHDNPSNTGSGTTSSHSLAAAETSTSVASPSLSASSASPNASDSSTGDSGVLQYQAGTYAEHKLIDTDLTGNTIELTSITVKSDGSVSALLTYTAASSGQWTCALSKAGEATLSIGDGTTDSSTGNDCTKDPTKTWNMTAGQTFSGSEYFSQAPAGNGDWTFSFDDGIEFQGSVDSINIPAQ